MYNVNWCSKIECVFAMLNWEEQFLNGEIVDIQEATDKFSNIMHDKWVEAIPFHAKLRLYSMHKQNICLESYLQITVSKCKRSVFSQLRMGILPLNIETGRYYRIPLEDRICTLCDSGEIEDEFHFVSQCSCFTECRDKYYNIFSQKITDFSNLDAFEKFCAILSTKPFVKLSINFINELWFLRKSILYN